MNQLCQTQLNYCSMKRLLCTMIMQFRVSVYCVIFYTQNSACATVPGNSYYFTDLGVDLQNVPTALFQKRSCSLKLVKNYFSSGHGQPDRCWYWKHQRTSNITTYCMEFGDDDSEVFQGLFTYDEVSTISSLQFRPQPSLMIYAWALNMTLIPISFRYFFMSSVLKMLFVLLEIIKNVILMFYFP